MKDNKGVTLMSLIIYVMVMLLVIGIMTIIINDFYQNTTSMQASTEDVLGFNKFNTYFLKEIKTYGNSLDNYDNVNNKYILFTTGNSFSLSDQKLYYNDVILCKNVKNFDISIGKDGDGVDKTIINITIKINDFEKTISYKIEDIY